MRTRADMSSLVRALLVVVAGAQADLGLWGTAAPRSLFDSYPGFGHHWISALGPYNEHLIRDFAAAQLGFAVLLVCAAIWFERRLVLVAGAAFIAATLPHFAYHLTTTDTFSTADNTTSLLGFGLELAVVIAAMIVSRRPTDGLPHAAAHASLGSWRHGQSSVHPTQIASMWPSGCTKPPPKDV